VILAIRQVPRKFREKNIRKEGRRISIENLGTASICTYKNRTDEERQGEKLSRRKII